MPQHRSAKPMQPGDPRLIVRWARRYAKSRTISFLVQWVFIVVMVSVVAVAASLTYTAQRADNMALFSISVAIMILSIVGLSWFSVSRWGGELIWRITQWLYGEEGYAAYDGERPGGTPWWMTALGGGLVVYHLVGALLVSFAKLPLDMMQPFSAAYMVPFLIALIVFQDLGFWAWLWPLLYAAHAILLMLGGNPFPAQGEWALLHLVVPVFGYGFISILTGHIYSRFALWQLKRLARTGLTDSPQEDAHE